MRLSSMKGAHADLSSAACRKCGASRSFFARCGIPPLSPANFMIAHPRSLEDFSHCYSRRFVDNVRQRHFHSICSAPPGRGAHQRPQPGSGPAPHPGRTSHEEPLAPLAGGSAMRPLAASKKPRLDRVLGRRDLVLLFVVAVANLNLIPAISSSGPVTLWLWLLALSCFFWPQGTAVTELAQKWP